MAVKIENSLDLSYGAPLGDTGWNVWMDENLVKLGAVAQISVIDKTTAAPPALVNGNRYIVATGATGAWLAKDGQLACAVDGDWVYYTLKKGWLVHDESDDSVKVWNGTSFVEPSDAAITAAITSHSADADPHGDRAYSDGQLSATEAAVGLAIADATSDANAYTDTSISTHSAALDPHGDRAYADAGLATKQATLVSGTNLKSVNGSSLLGAGDLTIGLQQFTEARNIAAPNATVPAHILTANGAESRVDFVITPKNYGAIIGFYYPDNTTTGGNKRGLEAVDFQSGRSLASQVASGSQSFQSSGYACTASGSRSANVGSITCVASSTDAGNYSSDTCTASAILSVNVGSYGSTVSGTRSGAYSVTDTTISGQRCAAIGGEQHNVTGTGSVAIAGVYGNTRSLVATVAFGRHNFNSPLKLFIPTVTATTSGAVTTTITLDGANHLAIDKNLTAFRIVVTGTASDTSTGANPKVHCFWLTGLVHKNGAASSLAGTVDKVYKHNAGADVADANVTVDDTTDTLRISVTGAAGKDILWSARIELDERN